MAKGQTKNKRARRPDSAETVISRIPSPYPVAYFSLPGNRSGFAEATSGGAFYHPCEPVTRFQVVVIPNPASVLAWTRSEGWTGSISTQDLPFITPAIEKSFSPLKYRFQLRFE